MDDGQRVMTIAHPELLLRSAKKTRRLPLARAHSPDGTVIAYQILLMPCIKTLIAPDKRGYLFSIFLHFLQKRMLLVLIRCISGHDSNLYPQHTIS